MWFSRYVSGQTHRHAHRHTSHPCREQIIFWRLRLLVKQMDAAVEAIEDSGSTEPGDIMTAAEASIKAPPIEDL